MNTVLAETFQQAGTQKTDASELHARRQPYSPRREVAGGRGADTVGADLQADRLELEIVGWGRDEESWSLAYIVLATPVRAREEHRGGVRRLGLPPVHRADVLPGASPPRGHPQDVSRQGRGGSASDLAAHVQQGERQSSTMGELRRRSDGSS